MLVNIILRFIVLRYLILGLLSLSISIFSCANMASPIDEGTTVSTAYSSKDIDILSETIDINIDKGFNQADYNVTYEIYSAKEGYLIPLVFEVFDLIGNDADKSFLVEVDGQAVPVLINYDYKSQSKSLPAYYDPETDTAVQFYSSAKYFEVNLSEGNHVINVQYSAHPIIDRSHWTNQYIYQYSLKPAKAWKSFGDLTINLKIADELKYLETNLGKPVGGKITTESKWYFDRIPKDVLEISYHPLPSFWIQGLINVDGRVVFLGLIVLFGFIHYRLLRSSREKRSKKANVILWLGIVIVPFLALMITMFRIEFIDWLLGEHASKYHGYIVFIVIFCYPLALPVYLVIMILCNSHIKRLFPNDSIVDAKKLEPKN